jgi:GNAT superfamily N-acetyltransferase
MTQAKVEQAVVIRRMHPSEMPLAVRLADSVFRNHDPDKKSFGKSHPQLFAPALSQSFAAFIDGKPAPVSFVGLVPSVIRIGAAKINCFSIGGVCTDPEYRGRGYAGQVLEKVYEHIDLADGALVLISGDRSIYTRTNCFHFGSLRHYRIDADAASRISAQTQSPDVKLREFKATDWFGLAEMAASRDCAFEQGLWDLALLLEAEPVGAIVKQHHKVLVAEEDGRITAFAVIGIPYHNTKFDHRVFEWGGKASLVASLLAEAVHRYGVSVLIMQVPWHEKKLIELLDRQAEYKSTSPNGGTIRIVRPERLIRQLRPYLQGIDPRNGGDLHIVSHEDGGASLHLFDRSVSLDQRSLASLLFDSEPDVGLDEEMGKLLRPLFPIPFPYAEGLNFV